MALFIIAIIVFIIADILIRYISKKINQNKILHEREEALKVNLTLDFSSEAKTLKRVEVKNPKAKILCVDDELVILDSFRKILVIDGYNVDTVESGKEAVGLVQNNNYDFVYTDLKMPEMDGVEVTKSVKHLRPDIDVVIITGYATVETAVECMKFGAMDYVQKPFTEDELLEFTGKALIKREDRIQKMIKPRVHITSPGETVSISSPEFSLPGGVFLSKGHCWVTIGQNGEVNIGIDDFARKIIGKIDSVDFPEPDRQVKKGEPLFTVIQQDDRISFYSPFSGTVKEINKFLIKDVKSLEKSPYNDNWICKIKPQELDTQIKQLKIGVTAVSLIQDDIEELLKFKKKRSSGNEEENIGCLYIGEMEKLDTESRKLLKDILFNK
jgi:CheY-like chemotaxis protein